ncbi:MAG: hypothetical protein IJ514_04160 [Clostridia bacterium]|nr:hypothetical protein [Clostridia bacterium]
MKAMKRFISVFAAAILCFATLAFTACGEEKATAYTVIVTDTNGTTLEGITVGICSYDEATQEKGNCLTPVATDADGKAVIEADEGTYIVNDDTLPSGYACKEKYVLKAYGEYTIVVVND